MSLFPSNEGHCRVTLVTERMVTFSDPAGNMSKAHNLLQTKQRDKSDTLSATPLGNLVGSGKRVT